MLQAPNKADNAIIADAAKFTAAVWHDARSLQADAEKKYGYIGF